MDQKSPDAFRTISEVAEWLDTPAHVLRFWESRFPQVKPVKRAGGRRYYRPSDMALLGGIKKLLHEDGMTIRGVQRLLKAEGVRSVAALSAPVDDIGAPMTEDAVAAPADVHLLDLPRRVPPPEEEAEAAPEEEFETGLAAALATTPATPPLRPTTPAAPDPAPADMQAPPVPETAPTRPGLEAIPEVPGDDDPGFAPRPPAFPLGQPATLRARLRAHPAQAAALYARLLDLAGRMDSRAR